MASELKLDKLTGATSAAAINITAEGGSTTTSLQQGLAKSWVNSDGDASTPAARDSLNVSSVTDSATGKGIFVVTNNFGNDDFAVTAGGSTELVALNRNTTSWANSTSQYGFVTYKTDGDSVFDFDQVLCVAHGDLA
tara:strand:- start:6419 stop:6829 length:411 start_codon:yes stop_codon:yes gene_type:complete